MPCKDKIRGTDDSVQRQKIAIASDHRGYEMKTAIRDILTASGFEPVDFGCFDDNPVDYPDLAYAAARAVTTEKVLRAVLICSTGIGMCIAANKVKGIRAVLCLKNARPAVMI